MQLLEAQARIAAGPTAEPRSRRRRLHVTEGKVVFLVCAAGYLAVATYLVLIRHCIFGDALSRVANAQFVLSSRDPHLASIGFVWNPLPSLVLVPFVPLRGLMPAVFTTGYLGSISTALFMAGAVAVFHGTLADLRIGRVTRWLLTAVFALHPMVVLYAANGMSEAPLLFFVLLTSRHLIRWLEARDPASLMRVGMALGGAYLTRYEAVAPGLAVICLVLALTAWRTPGDWLARRRAAFADGAVVALPFLFTFGMWAVISRVIVKQWFPTLQSEYGNSAQVSGSRRLIEQATGADLAGRLSYAGHQLLGLEPLAAVLVVLVLLVAALRRDARGLAPLAVAGAVLAFDLFAFLTGKSFGWLRFEIAVIPLAALSAALLVALLPSARWIRWTAGAVVIALLLPAFATTVLTLLDRRLAREETEVLRGALLPHHSSVQELDGPHRWEPAWAIASYIDHRSDIRRGKVLTDAAFSFPVLLASRHTDKYVITPDEDFKPKLADPVTFGVTFLLVPNPESATFDALNVAYPNLFKGGYPGSHLEREWKNAAGKPAWRLYRLPRAAAATSPS
jgi:hypothetical protein